MKVVDAGHPIGHYYSPVVDPTKLDRPGFEKKRQFDASGQLTGISIDDTAIVTLWDRFLPLLADLPFVKHQDERFRYYYENPFYGLGDAAFQFCLTSIARPKRYIEIGSGFSSACFLDTIDRHVLDTSCWFIEPFPDRLISLMRPDDLSRHRIIREAVQSSSIDVFDSLEKNDFLFIDSTHVAKAGSDVLFELFDILPRLKPGVIIHFHDTFWPFEYPTNWVFEKRYSWNELYMLRAFLSFNSQFEIMFFNDYFRHRHVDLIMRADLPEHLRILKVNCGGGLWLRRK